VRIQLANVADDHERWNDDKGIRRILMHHRRAFLQGVLLSSAKLGAAGNLAQSFEQGLIAGLSKILSKTSNTSVNQPAVISCTAPSMCSGHIFATTLSLVATLD
jgi:hypothetical protein